LQVIDGDLGRVESWNVAATAASERSLVSGHRRFRIPGVLDAKNRVHQRREVAEVDAAHGAVELIERVGFAALQGSDSGDVPVVGDVGGDVALLDRIGNIYLEVARKYMGTVKVRGGPGVA